MEGSSAGSGDAGSSRNSSVGSVEFLLKDCYHGVRARLYTSNTERNPFRRFQKCPVTKDYVRNMMRMNRSLEEQLNCKTMLVNLLSENVRLKSDDSGNSDGPRGDDARGVADREVMIEMRNTVVTYFKKPVVNTFAHRDSIRLSFPGYIIMADDKHEVVEPCKQYCCNVLDELTDYVANEELPHPSSGSLFLEGFCNKPCLHLRRPDFIVED
ncbi:hypothetical protein C2S52_011479 [Perilla frutescens var. hirtella]|nr:hypothetical protein C2S52_011479 [Perilla frutescens var. hirtella]